MPYFSHSDQIFCRYSIGSVNSFSLGWNTGASIRESSRSEFNVGVTTVRLVAVRLLAARFAFGIFSADFSERGAVGTTFFFNVDLVSRDSWLVLAALLRVSEDLVLMLLMGVEFFSSSEEALLLLLLLLLRRLLSSLELFCATAEKRLVAWRSIIRFLTVGLAE